MTTIEVHILDYVHTIEPEPTPTVPLYVISTCMVAADATISSASFKTLAKGTSQKCAISAYGRAVKAARGCNAIIRLVQTDVPADMNEEDITAFLSDPEELDKIEIALPSIREVRLHGPTHT